MFIVELLHLNLAFMFIVERRESHHGSQVKGYICNKMCLMWTACHFLSDLEWLSGEHCLVEEYQCFFFFWTLYRVLLQKCESSALKHCSGYLSVLSSIATLAHPMAWVWGGAIFLAVQWQTGRVFGKHVWKQSSVWWGWRRNTILYLNSTFPVRFVSLSLFILF